ncbi:hypothetical protein Plhal304r1_c008g0033151 [Plasmopara halstedii]
MIMSLSTMMLFLRPNFANNILHHVIYACRLPVCGWSAIDVSDPTLITVHQNFAVKRGSRSETNAYPQAIDAYIVDIVRGSCCRTK